MKPTFNPSSSEHLSCPFPTLAALRAEHPIFFLDRPPSPMWIVTRYEDCKALLNHDALSLNLNDADSYTRIAEAGEQTPHQIYMNNNFFALNGAAHRRLRHFTSAGFSPRVLSRMDGEIDRVVRQVLDPLHGRHAINFSEEVASRMPGLVIAALFRLSEDVVPLLTQLNLDSITPFSTEVSDDDKRAAISSFNKNAPAVLAWIRERRANPIADDYLSLVLQDSDEWDAIDENTAFSMILALLLTASDTTIDLLNLCILNLLQRPALQASVLQTDQALDAFIMESLRHEYFIYAGLGRYATRDFEYSGHEIRKGQMVRLFIESALRDENIYERPDDFIPQRDHRGSLAFGYGPHYCVGAALAKLEGRKVLRNFFEYFPEASLSAEPEYVYHPLNRRIGRLDVSLVTS